MPKCQWSWWILISKSAIHPSNKVFCSKIDRGTLLKTKLSYVFNKLCCKYFVVWIWDRALYFLGASLLNILLYELHIFGPKVQNNFLPSLLFSWALQWWHLLYEYVIMFSEWLKFKMSMQPFIVVSMRNDWSFTKRRHGPVSVLDTLTWHLSRPGDLSRRSLICWRSSSPLILRNLCLKLSITVSLDIACYSYNMSYLIHMPGQKMNGKR